MSEPLSFEDQSTKEFVVGLAKLLDVEVEQSHNEYCFNLPDKLGSGYIKAFVFDFGVSVLEIDCLLKEDFYYLRHRDYRQNLRRSLLVCLNQPLNQMMNYLI